MSNESRKRYMKDRAIEIIDTYLRYADYAKIKMTFRKANGETQRKTLIFTPEVSDTKTIKVVSYAEWEALIDE